MKKMNQICNFMSSNIAVFILIFSVIAFFCPKGFSWATNYTTIFLGVAMFGMGLTIRAEDFRVVFTRPKELFAGCVLQYTVMPLTAFALAKLFGLPDDLEPVNILAVGYSDEEAADPERHSQSRIPVEKLVSYETV